MNRRRKWRRQQALAVAVGETRTFYREAFRTGFRLQKDEIFVDSFAGGGGASCGIESAIGRSVDEAINHDPAAIAMHEANHPGTRHHLTDVWKTHPFRVAAGRRVGLLWLSPDCTHHSKARGGKPRKKEIRGLAWVGVWWAGTVRPRVIMLENVEEFVSWGPLDKEGQPDLKQKGRTFNTFVNALRYQGYDVEWRELRAFYYGTPTIRKRFFLIARCDGQPIVWPEPTYADPRTPAVQAGRLKPWRTAAECIDWSIPCPSIFERKKELAENTKRRIARGIMKFVINNPNPFIIRFTQSGFGGTGMQYPMDQPLTTIMVKAEHALVTPVLAVNTTRHPGSSPDEPLRTVTTGGHHMLVAPTIIQTGYGEKEGQAPRALDIGKPLGTVVAGGGKHAVISAELAIPHITKFRTGATGSAMDEPLHTITSGAGSIRPAGAAHAMGMVTAFLTQYHTETASHDARGQILNRPLLTQDTSNRFGLVTSHLMKMRGDNIGQRVDDPLHTITAGGNHHAEVRAFLVAYYGSSVGQSLDDPLGTVTTHDRFGIVTIHGIDYQIVDIGMRMLEPHELYAAQGFPSNYIISGYQVNGKPVTKSDQVARCGNSVPPQFAEALVRANMPEHCTGSGNRFAFERYRPAMDRRGQLELSM